MITGGVVCTHGLCILWYTGIGGEKVAIMRVKGGLDPGYQVILERLFRTKGKAISDQSIPDSKLQFFSNLLL